MAGRKTSGALDRIRPIKRMRGAVVLKDSPVNAHGEKEIEWLDMSTRFLPNHADDNRPVVLQPYTPRLVMCRAGHLESRPAPLQEGRLLMRPYVHVVVTCMSMRISRLLFSVGCHRPEPLFATQAGSLRPIVASRLCGCLFVCKDRILG